MNARFGKEREVVMENGIKIVRGSIEFKMTLDEYVMILGRNPMDEQFELEIK